MQPDLYGWDWKAFRGTKAVIRYANRDLPFLDKTIGRCQQTAVAVQAGGNLGLYPKRLAQHFNAVYTFEPDPVLFAAMQRNAPELNIYRFQAALGDTRGGVSMSQERRDATGKLSHEGLTHVAGKGPIPTLRIDDLGLEVCDLICLDVEGWELYALRGAVETIRRCRPVLCVEINKNQKFVGLSETAVRDFLTSRAYHAVERCYSDEVYEAA